MDTRALTAPANSAAPRTRVLISLGAGVLLAHLSLLSGGLSGLSLDMFVAPDAELSGDRPDQAPSGQPPEPTVAALEPELPEPVRSSRVRWIVPKAPEPAPPPPPQKIIKPPPPPEPVVVVVETPPPEPVVEPTPPPVAEVVVAAPPEPPVEPTQPPVQAPVSDLKPGADVVAGTVQGAGLGAADASLPPAAVPPSVQLRYDVKGLAKSFNYTASGRLDWSHDGSTYEASMTVKALFLGSRGQTSAGRLSDKGLAPDRFTDRSRSERAAHFERSTSRIRYSNNAPDAPLLPGAQDRLSVNLQLAALFNARPDAYAEGQTLRLPVSSHDVSEVWLFRVGPLVTERLPAGDIVARKLTRSPRKEFDKTVEIWLGPTIAHLPVRLRITESNGDFVDMQLEQLPVLAPETSNVP